MDISTRLEPTPVEVESAAGRFAALADPARLRILAALGDGQLCVCDIQERVPIAGNLLSYHLRVLREAGLISGAKRGRWIDYRLDGDGFQSMWALAGASGVPLPGEQVAEGTAGRSCDDADVAT